jgi:hypothetical protein
MLKLHQSDCKFFFVRLFLRILRIWAIHVQQKIEIWRIEHGTQNAYFAQQPISATLLA